MTSSILLPCGWVLLLSAAAVACAPLLLVFPNSQSAHHGEDDMGQLVTADPHAGAGRDATCAASRGGTKTTPPPLMGGLLRAGPLEHLHACSLLAAATYGPCCAPASFPCSSAAPCSARACRRSYTRPVASPLRAAAALVGLRAATASPACAVPPPLPSYALHAASPPTRRRYSCRPARRSSHWPCAAAPPIRVGLTLAARSAPRRSRLVLGNEEAGQVGWPGWSSGVIDGSVG